MKHAIKRITTDDKGVYRTRSSLIAIVDLLDELVASMEARGE